MYFIFLFMLLFAVYFAPALAFSPNLLRKPQTAIAIPVVSSIIVVVLASILLFLKIFNHDWVLAISIFFIIIATYRVGKLLLCEKIFYQNSYKLIFFNLILMLPFFVKLGTHSFSEGDEIYSWNYWAIQHYLNLPPDFTHTGAPYPQFLPKLLAYQYQLVGNIDYQLPIKALLGLFPLTLLNTFAIACGHRNSINKLKYGLLILWIVFGIGLQHFFNDGYADPIMCASLVLSVYYAWLAYKTHKNNYWLLAVVTAWVAAYAKQPGLLCLGFILPLGYMAATYADFLKNKLKSLFFILVTTGMACWWLFTEGRNFQHNGGVIGASLQQREVYAHLKYLVDFYFVQQPVLGLFLFLSLIGLVRYTFLTQKIKSKRFTLFIFGFLALPYVILWFVFGAYQLRLGQHVIALLTFLIILSGYRGLWLFNEIFKYLATKFNFKLNNLNPSMIYVFLIILSVFGSGLIGYKQEYKQMKGIAWQEGGVRTLQTYFPDSRKMVVDNLYKKPDVVIWVPTRYLYGIFYGHTPVVIPEQNWTIQNLIQSKPNYIITASKEITAANWVEQLAGMIQYCPTAFTALNEGRNRFQYIVYEVDGVILKNCYDRS